MCLYNILVQTNQVAYNCYLIYKLLPNDKNSITSNRVSPASRSGVGGGSIYISFLCSLRPGQPGTKENAIVVCFNAIVGICLFPIVIVPILVLGS